MLVPTARPAAFSRRIWLPLSLLVVAFAIFPASAAAYIYFPNGIHIGRAHNDGTGLEPNFITTETFNCGIAVDGGHLYWGAIGKGISRANVDGTGVEEAFIPLSPAAAPCGVAVDSAHVFWTDRNGAVGIADLNGASANPALVSIEEPCGIASDGGHVYFAWRSGTEFHLSGFPLPYSGLEAPLTATTGNCGVAIDSQKVYWANGGPASTMGQTVQFASRDPFGAPATLAVTEGGAKKPWSVAVHGEYAYYSAYNGPISRVRADGGTPPEPNFLPLGGAVETVGIAVDDLPLPPVQPDPSSPPSSSGGGRSSGGGAGPSGGGPGPAPGKPTIFLGKPKVNPHNGTAKVTATVSGPGVVKVSGKKVTPAKVKAKRAGKVKLPIRARRSAVPALRRDGHLRVSFTASFTAANGEQVSAKRNARLVLAGK